MTLEASNITQNSAVLWGYVNPMELIPGVEIGIIVSKAENPSVENGTKLVSVEIDNNNKFFVEARGLLGSETRYYYRAFLNVSGTYRVGDVKSFTTEAFGFGAIDLGLSVKWANANLGANSQEDFGYYFFWGETKPCEWGDVYENKFYDGSSYIKYNNDDHKTVLDPEDDAAYVILGGKWRMPTIEEWDELIIHCTIEQADLNGVSGIVCTSQLTGNNIFLPATIPGQRYGSVFVVSESGSDYCGHYWSSSLEYLAHVWGFSFNVPESEFDNFYWRITSGWGEFCSIRPVSDY